ncbi:MAG TPA: aminodeoxychorismate lyase [Acidiferrobacteraceae bacterium]|nr:aminodeoxychorismate lyase [Acidiferrobacteraceae bacterium]
MSTYLKCWVNGELQATLSVADRGLHYGDGLFETMAVVEGAIPFWPRHLKRLRQGCARLGIEGLTPDRVLGDEIVQVCTGQERAIAKLIVTRGTGDRGYRSPSPQGAPTRILSLAPWPDHVDRVRRTGARLRYCDTTVSRHPTLAGIKHLNRLEQVLARQEWDSDFDEGLMCDNHGLVIEGTMSNLFAVSQGAIMTPDLSQCGVAGIVRNWVMEQAQAMEIPLEIGGVDPHRLTHADEIFVTNSIIGIVPVRQLADRDYLSGTTTKKFIDQFPY